MAVHTYAMGESTTNRRIEVNVDVIVHATESAEKILDALETTLGIAANEFLTSRTVGHFGNTISILRSTITGKVARLFVNKFCSLLSQEQKDALVGQIEERVVNSRLHVRIDKQKLVRDGQLTTIDGNADGGDTIKIKIHTPVYNKRDTVSAFTEILSAGSS